MPAARGLCQDFRQRIYWFRSSASTGPYTRCGFWHRGTLTANQIQFVNLVIDYLTQSGWIRAAQLYESPSTDFSPRGVEGARTHLLSKRSSIVFRCRATRIPATIASTRLRPSSMLSMVACSLCSFLNANLKFWKRKTPFQLGKLAVYLLRGIEFTMPKTTSSASTNGGVPNPGKRVEERFGVLPNFFRLAPETPEITEKLWGFAQAAYLDNPLPSVFKERLFVHLSRFCAVRYCIARHVGFLVGLGRPAGDPTARTQSVTDVVKLLRRPFPADKNFNLVYRCAQPAPHPLLKCRWPTRRWKMPSLCWQRMCS